MRHLPVAMDPRMGTELFVKECLAILPSQADNNEAEYMDAIVRVKG